MRTTSIVLLFAAFLVTTTATCAQIITLEEIYKLEAPEGIGEDATSSFGKYSDISRDGTVVIASLRKRGAVVFTQEQSGNWTHDFLDVSFNLDFGDPRRVAISGDGETAIVGFYRTTLQRNIYGGVVVFDNNNGKWEQGATIFASDLNDGEHFANEIAISDDGSIVAVTSNSHVHENSQSGAVYIFEKLEDGRWQEVQEIFHVEPTPIVVGFGSDLSLSGDGTTLATSFGYYPVEGGERKTVVAIYDRYSSVAFRPGPTLSFGHQEYISSLAVSQTGDMLTLAEGYVVDSTHVYRYNRDVDRLALVETGVFNDEATGGQDAYGSDSVILGNHNVVATTVFEPEAFERAAHVFVRHGEVWEEAAVLIPSDAASNNHYYTIAAGAQKVVVGGQPMGAVYVFDLSGLVVSNELDEPITSISFNVFPNPARDNAQIRLSIDRPQHIRIQLFDALGRRVDEPYNQIASAGQSHIPIELKHLLPGIYFLQIIAEDWRSSERLTVFH